MLNIYAVMMKFHLEHLTFRIALSIFTLGDPTGRSLAGIAGSNPAEGVNICLL
jgi:hypothetical protein